MLTFRCNELPGGALVYLISSEYAEKRSKMKRCRTTFCKGCLQQLHLPIPIHGPLSVPFRIFGLRPSRMNPNLCNLCETMFKRIKKSSQIHVPLTILFADVRGYTSVSELLDTPEVVRLLTHFYEQCGEAVWEGDGIVNKLIGDAILAIFNFPIERDRHVENAVSSAITLQEGWDSRRSMGGNSQLPIGLGVGIHTGTVAVGEVGEACRDFTAVGPVVNLASRLQGAANPGEILVTEPVYKRVAEQFPNAQMRACQLKGFEKPVNAWVLKSAA
jgi:adenylate cyclase